MIDVNVYQENLFHTKMMLKETDLNTYLFGVTTDELEQQETHAVIKPFNRGEEEEEQT